MIPAPAEWEIRTFDDAGRLALVGVIGNWLHVLAPPGVRLWSSEPLEQRTQWRHACWEPDDDGETPLPALDEPEIDYVEALEALEMAGPERRDFVRSALDLQLKLAVTIARPRLDGSRVDIYEQAGARAQVRTRAELKDCFPEESWYEAHQPPKPEVPPTIDEVLELLPAPPRLAPRRIGLLRRALKQMLPPFIVSIGKRVLVRTPPRTQPAFAADEEAPPQLTASR